MILFYKRHTQTNPKTNRVTYRGALHPKITLYGYAYQIKTVSLWENLNGIDVQPTSIGNQVNVPFFAVLRKI